jgi:hypothetical protein
MGDNVPHKTLQVQEVVLRFWACFEGVALKLPQGDTIPLTPFLPAFGVLLCDL